MLIILLAYIGGLITIFSPCILPVLPFVFARADRPFMSSGLPMLLGMALTFAGVSMLASVGGAWVVGANVWGRILAMGVLAFFALTLLIPRLAEWTTRPFVQLGNRLSARTRTSTGFFPSILLGAATGLLWTPCAGPILGLVLTGSAFLNSPLERAGLLFAYGLGAMTSLALILSAGKQLFGRLKGALGFEEKLRRGIGIAILVGIGLILGGADRGILTNLSSHSTSFEERLISIFGSPNMAASAQGTTTHASAYADEGALPALPLPDTWVNHAPLDASALHGHVTLIDFWTYSCINCLRTVPFIRAWDTQYRKAGLIVIGVHTPEFAFERDRANVQQAIRDLHIDYPVALDNDYRVWRAFNNEYWPAEYLIDGQGHIRYHAFGEGHEHDTEAAIRALLAEEGKKPTANFANVEARGVGVAPDDEHDQSPETYLGSARSTRFAGQANLDAVAPTAFVQQLELPLNGWGLGNVWSIESERIVLKHSPGAIAFRFHARDLHLVLGPTQNAHPIHFRVWVDGHALGRDNGVDVDAAGRGIVREQRLYQLIRQHSNVIRDHTAVIEFLDPQVAAYAFTFG